MFVFSGLSKINLQFNIEMTRIAVTLKGRRQDQQKPFEIDSLKNHRIAGLLYWVNSWGRLRPWEPSLALCGYVRYVWQMLLS